MKNIHVLPTDKPSRLRYFNGKLELMYLIPKKSDIIFQNIYITSDEEIKNGDWYYHLERKTIHNTVEKADYFVNNTKYDKFKKIILTTDVDLIKDGVQAIDDEFLEWFVKNPSCEEVGIEDYGNLYNFRYLILIPKEEPKQETLGQMPEKQENCCTPVGHIRRYKDCIGCDRKPKQETPIDKGEGEAYRQELFNYLHDNFVVIASESEMQEIERIVLSTQQERMYSEEEVENILIEYVKTNPTKPYRVINWFRQIKKK